MGGRGDSWAPHGVRPRCPEAKAPAGLGVEAGWGGSVGAGCPASSPRAAVRHSVARGRVSPLCAERGLELAEGRLADSPLLLRPLPLILLGFQLSFKLAGAGQGLDLQGGSRDGPTE